MADETSTIPVENNSSNNNNDDDMNIQPNHNIDDGNERYAKNIDEHQDPPQAAASAPEPTSEQAPVINPPLASAPSSDQNQTTGESIVNINANSTNVTNGGQGITQGEAPVIGSAHIRPVFLGNLDLMVTAEEVEDIFLRPALDIPPMAVDHVDLKRGFAFVFLHDAKTQEEKERVVRYVDGIYGMDFPKVSKSLRAEFARGDGRTKRKEDERRKQISPNSTLFIVNFSEETTKREDLEMLFSPYGELVRIDMKRNYAFVQFTNVEDATKAKDATNGGKLDQSVITVEYVAQRRRDRDDFRGRGGDRDRGSFRGGRRDYGGRRDRDRDYDRRRSPPRYRDDDRYDGYRDGRGRSRSRSPGARYHRSRSRSPRRDRDDNRGRFSDRYDSRHNDKNDRDNRDSGRDFDSRGYR